MLVDNVYWITAKEHYDEGIKRYYASEAHDIQTISATNDAKQLGPGSIRERFGLHDRSKLGIRRLIS